ncbi:MAG: aminoacetone oxidase family FAD-binding enzyme [Gammaproteobacteria bacterium]|nr:aminoacetone oxidase family FAD-binding enzyme [Gammaproteobacteria bacterium]
MPYPAHNAIPEKVDVLVIGAGAAGLMCAITAGQRGRSVLLIEHANKVGKKILMSGGGRCNFINIYAEAGNYLSQNPHFCKSALSRYTSQDFINLVEKHHIAFHEKKSGQLFCDNKAKDILDMLLNECKQSSVSLRTHCSIENIEALESGFKILSNLGELQCQSLVIATGGLSIPKMGASAFGYEVAKQFGLNLVPMQAALVPFTLGEILREQLSSLSGSSLPVSVSCNGASFNEDMLFTHRGLSGPEILQISSYWNPGSEVHINLLPQIDLFKELKVKQNKRPKAVLKTVLTEYMSKNTTQVFLDLWFSESGYPNQSLNQFTHQQFQEVADHFHHWVFKPSGTKGYRTAEVTLGGVSTDEISSKTMQAKKQPGLYFIGEVLDVTGQLGGFNFQWAWASAVAAGNYI